MTSNLPINDLIRKKIPRGGQSCRGDELATSELLSLSFVVCLASRFSFLGEYILSDSPDHSWFGGLGLWAYVGAEVRR